MSSSAHPFTISGIGPTGAEGVTLDGYPMADGSSGWAVTGSMGPIGTTGPTGTTGGTGATYNVVGVTFSSTGSNAYHLIVQYDDGTTSDGGYYRGPTGAALYPLYGVNMGYITGGAFYHDTINGVMYLKSITGGGGLVVESNEELIRIKYRTHNAAVARGNTGELAFLSQNSGGETGLSGATLTQFFPGPTAALKVTNYRHSEVSGRIRPVLYSEEHNLYVYEIDPDKSLSVWGAKNNRSMGNTFIIDPYSDYKEEFNQSPSDTPDVKIIDVSQTHDQSWDHYDRFESDFGPFASVGFTLIIKKSLADYVNYPYNSMFPSNWKFPYSLNPRTTNDIDIIQFITLGYYDTESKRTEWYGMYVRSDGNPWRQTD